jgi:hypothetical protein
MGGATATIDLRPDHPARRRGGVANRGARAAGRMFADIWDYSDVKSEAVPSFAILTDEPNELVAPYHDRMPVVLGDLERGLTSTPRSMMSTRSDRSVSPCARSIGRSTRSRKRISTRSSAPPEPLRCAAFYPGRHTYHLAARCASDRGQPAPAHGEGVKAQAQERNR